MSKLNDALEIRSMAVSLKLDPRLGAVSEIVRFCNEKIASIAAEASTVKNVLHLQELVCRKLGLVFEEIWSDEDLVAVSQKYVQMDEPAFASLSMQLEGKTYATLMRRDHAKKSDRDRYVAVIDCRGEKAARRYFTRWHEIAHLLTLVRQLDLPFHRSEAGSEDPLERLMDVIAGQVGFYGPLFEPTLERELESGVLTFDAIDRVRASFCDEASYQATMIACVSRCPSPIVLVEAKLALKRSEQRELNSRQTLMFPVERPKAKLRAVNATPNTAARDSGFRVDRNMAIPPTSIITRHFEQTENQVHSNSLIGEEELAIWRHSDGTAIGFGKIRVEARRVGGGLLALIQPIEIAAVERGGQRIVQDRMN